jgi:hydrogenase nickel incorporation protein HypA/HybF
MHELPLVESLVGLACSKARENGASRVTRVELTVGELCDALPEWIERYFRVAARGTIAEGAGLEISAEPARASCAGCGRAFAPPSRPVGPIACPRCGSTDCALIAGLDWRLERIEVA